MLLSLYIVIRIYYVLHSPVILRSITECPAINWFLNTILQGKEIMHFMELGVKFVPQTLILIQLFRVFIGMIRNSIS